MKKFTFRKYQASDASDWNEFVKNSVNGTFLFDRDFMDYHSDRFIDHSIIITEENKWIAILPANIYNQEIHSHQGLTYGGLLFQDDLKLKKLIEIVFQLLQYLHSINIQKLQIKTIPSIYHKKPADGFLYVLFLLKAKLTRRDPLSVIDLSENLPYLNDSQSNISVGIRKSIANELVIEETDDLTSFWSEILEPNLMKKFNTKPVHSLAEIQQLKNKFPKNIRQFNMYFNNQIISGTTIFVTDQVAHSQYISTNDFGAKRGSLFYLHHQLFTEIFAEKKYFDFGISTENQGLKLNFGLSSWKESFGATTIVQDFYEVETINYQLLNDFFND